MDRTLYSNASDPIGIIEEERIPIAIGDLLASLQELDSFSPTFSRKPLTKVILYLQTYSLEASNRLALLAAKVHFHSFAFFISPSSPTRLASLSVAYDSANNFMQGQFI